MQLRAYDAYNGSCFGDRANCPPEPGPDFDFASSVILTSRSDRRDVLLAGQKSGIVHALDPANNGEIVWQTRVGQGGATGGVQWGMAADGQRVYAAVSDVGRVRQTNPFDTRRFVLDPKQGGGVTALRVADRTMRASPPRWHASIPRLPPQEGFQSAPLNPPLRHPPDGALPMCRLPMVGLDLRDREREKRI